MTLPLLLLAAALLQDAPPTQPPANTWTATEIAWVRRPAPDFPQRAMQEGVWDGVVWLRCTVAPRGRFTRCEVTSESHEGVGFGQAALLAMRGVRFEPAADGPQPGDSYEGTLRFYVPPELRSH
jgi:TonB family protein